ncbi:hypothetical protein ACFVIM_03445 [Streptomyces sp. NPDC057638]|uniref:hypothetical protein n=1 Tax=Streptomyces sp. NPDC057638 TaxID=3346190 RepID=UPI0036A16D76
MPISAKMKSNYGDPAITSKYTPLEEIGIGEEERAYCSGILTSRMNLLRRGGLINHLWLTVESWDALAGDEETQGRQPPLVVVSSNRANWIARGIEAAADHLAENPAYADVGDLRALGTYRPQGRNPIPGPTSSPPFYAPARVGAGRGIYIVVHEFEYSHYRESLRGTGITVVGWRFRPPPSVAPEDKVGKPSVELTGFGASRFAALQFCKALRGRAANRWNSAWLLDDNVVALAGFPGFGTVEGVLGDHTCIGFQAGTQALPQSTIQTWAAGELNGGRGLRCTAIPNFPIWEAPTGLVQQVVLWNIGKISRESVNISPAFIASAEDVSITNYLKLQDHQSIGQLTRISVKKESAETDDSNGAKQLLRTRDAFTQAIAQAESRASGGPPYPVVPPPVWLRDGDSTTEMTVGAFIDAKQKGKSPAARFRAKCQVVEQVTARALNLGLLDQDVISAAFKIPVGDQPDQLSVDLYDEDTL